jgi:SWI/SNF-related matrix-associated actin-dependent regulator 1 of chromatin subfamily A
VGWAAGIAHAAIAAALARDAEIALGAGRLDLEAGATAKAAGELAHAVDELPDDAPSRGDALFQLGEAQLELGSLDKADGAVREALAWYTRRAPTRAIAARGTLVRVLAARGWYTDAITEQTAVIAASTGDELASAYMVRARLQLQRGDAAAAATDAAAAAPLATEPTRAAALALVDSEVLIRTGSPQDAFVRASVARDEFAKAGPIVGAIGDAAVARALVAGGRGEVALGLAQGAAAVIDGQPTAPASVRGAVYAALGAVALAQHDEVAAIAALRTAVIALAGVQPPDLQHLAEARLDLAHALAATDPAGARDVAKQALAAYPRDGDPALRAAATAWLARDALR